MAFMIIFLLFCRSRGFLCENPMDSEKYFQTASAILKHSNKESAPFLPQSTEVMNPSLLNLELQ